MKRKKTKSFFDLTPEEREREVARFDGPIDIDKDTRPMTARERAKWQKMVEDKPTIAIHLGHGKTDVIIYLDDELLAVAASYSRKHKTTLPKMIDRGLRGLLAFGS